MTHTEKHVARVEKWATDRTLLDTDDPMVQYGKQTQEAGELICALGKHDFEEIKDGIGDVRVCMINVCAIAGIEFTEGIKQSACNLSDKTLVRLLMHRLTEFYSSLPDASTTGVNSILEFIATKNGLTVEECDDFVWGVIENRTGTTVNGEFVKDQK